MRSVSLLFCLFCIACVPLKVFFTSSANDDKILDFSELQKNYEWAFDQRKARDYLALHEIVTHTQSSLDAGQLTAEQHEQVRRWQHKLRSFIAFSLVSLASAVEKEKNKRFLGVFGRRQEMEKPTIDYLNDLSIVFSDQPTADDPQAEQANEVKEPKRGLSVLLLEKLRATDATQINPDQSNHAFYQQAIEGNYDTKKVSQAAKDSFHHDLQNKIQALTSKSIRKYYRLFPFAQAGFLSTCQTIAAADCQHLQWQDAADNFPEPTFANVEQLTIEVNKTLRALNRVITLLKRLNTSNTATKDLLFFFRETNFEDQNVVYLYSIYELILSHALQTGILPVLLAPTFSKRAGNIYLNYKGRFDLLQRLGIKKEIGHSPGEIKFPLLTEVTNMTVQQSINELQHNIVNRWVELRQIHSANKTFADKKLYQWSVANDIATTQVISQHPVHSVVMMHLLERYQYKNRDPFLLRLGRTAAELAEVSAVVLLFGGAGILSTAFPVLAGVGLFGKAMVAAVGANFVWAGMAGLDTMVNKQRWLKLEQSLLSGTSDRVKDNLKLLREFHKVRRNAIVAGTIGVPMSVPSIKYALAHVYEGKKTFLVDAVAGMFSARGEFSYRGESDFDIIMGN